MCVDGLAGQLELQAAVSSLTWLLGTELKLSERVAVILTTE